LLREDVLQGKREFAKSFGFGPTAIVLFVFREGDVGKQPAAALRALFETAHQLIGKRLAQGFEFIGR